MTRREWDEIWAGSPVVEAPQSMLILIPAQRSRVGALDDLAG